VEVTPGASYKLEALVYIPSQAVAGVAQVGAFWGSDLDCTFLASIEYAPEVSTQDQWLLSGPVELVAPAGAQSAAVVASIKKIDADGAFVAFFDDVSFAPAPEPSPTVTPTATPTATPTTTPTATPTPTPTATPTPTPLSDTDSDGVPDVDDNCPFVPNNPQTNSDPLPAGDACQCGDVNNDGIVDSLDVQIVRENLVGSPLSGSFDPERCNVIGNSDCGVDDVFVLERISEGLPVSLQNICDAYSAP